MERRATARAHTYLGGQVAFNERFSTMDCLVRNMSGAGAKLDFSGAITIPDEVDLTITKRELTMRARIIWRRGGEAGVAFGQPQQPSGAVRWTGRVGSGLARRKRLRCSAGFLT